MQTYLEWFGERFPDELLENRDIEGYDRFMDLHNISKDMLLFRIWTYTKG